jgi:spore coat protein U domain-containing protein, fimbrial subunit CupE1/2/3/6
MKNRRLNLIGAFLGVAMWLLSVNASAFTAGPSPFTVSATVANFCTVSAGNVGFGTVSAGVAATNTASSITLNCNKGVTVSSVALDNGSNGSGTQKRMKGTVVTTDFVNYKIDVPTTATFQTCPVAGTGPEWNAANTIVATPLFTASGGAKTINICASIPAGQFPSGQLYSDTVNVTVTYN